MPLENQLQAAIDHFIDDRISRVPKAQEAALRFILDRTKAHVQAIIQGVAKGRKLTLEDLNPLCVALDAAPATFEPAVLNSIGVSDLVKEIIDYRAQVKWGIFIEEIRKIAPKDPDEVFTPEDIRDKNAILFRALREALKKEDEDFDWEALRDKLPPDLAEKFETQSLSREAKKKRVAEETKVLIDKLQLTDVVATLGRDPRKLAAFLDLTSLDLTEKQKARILYVSFRGLRETGPDSKLDKLMEELPLRLESIEIVGDIPPTTDQKTIKVKVRVPQGTHKLLVRGATNRDIKTNGAKEAAFECPLEPGEINKFILLAYDDRPRKRKRSEPLVISIEQTSPSVDIDALATLLESLKQETIDALKHDEKKTALFRRCIEESAVKHFAGDFEEGRKYLQRLSQTQHHPEIRALLDEILKTFERINAMEFTFIRKSERLLFFQKYCLYKIEQYKGDCLILANEPGLGKTVTALAATHDDEMLVVAPNSACSTWTEQEAKFFDDPFLENLATLPYVEREDILAGRKRRRGTLTNVEFVRHKSEPHGTADNDDPAKRPAPRKFKLLNERRHKRRRKTLVVDEAHFLKNESQQTEGIEQLDYDFFLLLSASPYRDPQALCRVMHKIFPEDERFKSLAAFEKAFPAHDVAAIKTLYLMMQPFLIRFRKSEVFSTYNPSKPLHDQPLSLPAKKTIAPLKTGIGRFTLTPVQQNAILEFFEDWDAWTKKYDHYMPKGELAELDGIRASNDQLSKTHALRQIMNDPVYIGSNDPSPKHEACMKILREELTNNTKVVIFCGYHGEVKVYARLLQSLGIEFCQYTGEITQKGYKKDEGGRDILYALDESDNYRFDASGNPVLARRGERGRKMLASDYERLVFQKNPKRMVMLATYSAGAQSVTFTAAGAMILDDLPRDYSEEYQATDRIHRIDDEHRKYEVRYYRLMAQYDQAFLRDMRDEITTKTRPDGDEVEISAFDRWFAQGTFDEVRSRRLAAQRVGFELLNDGIATDPDLAETEARFQF